MYCNNCGKHNPEGSKFCQSCGAKMVKVSDNTKVEDVKEQQPNNEDKKIVENTSNSTNAKKKSSYTHWLLWWILDKNELEKQVKEYKTLGIWHSARKISALLLLFSSIITIGMVAFFNYDSSSLIDVAMMLVLAFFIYRGHRWAMILAMLYWTYAKFYGLYTSYSSGSTVHTNGIVVIIWWATYMHAFWEAFKVEQLKRKESHVL